jgi:hypothetical protein
MESEPSPAQSDGAGRYQNHLAVVRLKGRDSMHNRFDPFEGKFAFRTGDCAGSQFDDHAFCTAQKANSPLIVLM